MQVPAAQPQIDDRVLREIHHHLRAEERLLWLGQPAKDTPMNAAQKLNLIGGSVALAGFIVIGLLTSYWGFFAEVAILICFGAGIAAGLIVFTVSNKKVAERYSTYVLTDQRAFSFIYDGELAVVSSLPLSTQTKISSRIKTATTGSLLFTRAHRKAPDLPRLTKLLPVNKRSSRLTFQGVHQPEYVQQVALWAAAHHNDLGA
jgi:hypothetical protein